VYCYDIKKHVDWMGDYAEYLAPVFTFDADLLVRIIRNVAKYFVVQSNRLMAANPPKYRAANSHLTWANTLYERYSKMENESLKKEFAEVNELMEKAEQAMKSSSDDES
jgi:hypothetical protein